MAISTARLRRSQQSNYWPGFVDALSSLLLVIIFLLSLFILAQFFLGQEILGKDTAMSRLNSQIAELTDLLQLERANTGDLESTIAGEEVGQPRADDRVFVGDHHLGTGRA